MYSDEGMTVKEKRNKARFKILVEFKYKFQMYE